MTLFWTAAAGLIALALALVLPTLWRPARGERTAAAPRNAANLAILREQLKQLDGELAAGGLSADQHQVARAEIERRALDEEGNSQAVSGSSLPPSRSTRTALGLAVSIPAVALGLYAWVGNPQAVLPQTQVAGKAPEGEITREQVEAMVAGLAKRLESVPAGEPADPKAWEMLARSYSMLQRFPEADKAYLRAISLAPGNAQLLADRADVLAMLQGQSALGEPTRLLDQALALDPDNLKALALAGSAAFERKDFPAALGHWTKARGLVEPGSDLATGLDGSIAEARAALAQDGAAASKATVPAPSAAAAASTAPGAQAAAAPSPPVVAGGAQISGEVSLSPTLASRVAPGDTVFIFARAAQGPRMPLAILKRRAGELPLRFTLDDSTAMSGDMSLSKFDRVVVGVRVSKSGNATPQPGDLTGQAGPVKNVASGLSILIDGVVP
jgi:cytochrome c-type biogenesis protein CcmH